MESVGETVWRVKVEEGKSRHAHRVEGVGLVHFSFLGGLSGKVFALQCFKRSKRCCTGVGKEKGRTENPRERLKAGVQEDDPYFKPKKVYLKKIVPRKRGGRISLTQIEKRGERDSTLQTEVGPLEGMAQKGGKV